MTDDRAQDAPLSLQPRGLGQILSAALDFYGRHWRVLMVVAAAVVIPLTLLNVLALAVFAGTGGEVNSYGGGLSVSGGGWGAALSALLLGIVSFLAYQLLVGAITRAVAEEAADFDAELESSYRVALSRLAPILGATILVGLAVAGGFILLIIPGLFLLTRFAVTIPALVIEGRGATDSMSRSWELVRGNGWHTFGVIVVAGLITGLANGLIQGLFGSQWVAGAIGSALAAIVTLPFTTAVNVLLYLDLRARSETLDTAILRRDLVASSPPGVSPA